MSTGASNPEPSAAPRKSGAFQVVLTGNPNCGKTTLFNALTGLRAKVGNYSGVTVERKEGRLLQAPKDCPITILDLPGTYSLSPQSLDEQVARDVLFHRLKDVPPPDLVVVVADASNLQRNLYFVTQVIELGYPTIVALNMIDVARENGHEIDAAQLGGSLGAPVIPLVASRGEGLEDLRRHLIAAAKAPAREISPRPFYSLPKSFADEIEQLAGLLEQTFPESHFQATAEAMLVLSDERFLNSSVAHYPDAIRSAVTSARERLEKAGVDWRSAIIESRYCRLTEIQQSVTTETEAPQETFSDRLDRLVTHRIWGVVVFVALMLLMFQSIFTFAKWPMDWLQGGVDWIGGWVGGLLPPGDLNSLLEAGVVQGVGAVVVFLPQILLLFFFISILEDTGYMARAAFLMDRLMSKVGLHGKSFIPMLSSFACAIPGIMATRTIESPKDRLVTILVAPLMSCSARLPVYTLLIAACVPDRRVFGFVKLQGLTMLSMYLLGIIMALTMAWLFKKTLLKGPTPMLIMELPPYKRPVLKVVMRHMWDRSKLFLSRAGTVILGINILLWFLATYPRNSATSAEFAAQRAALTNAVANAGQPDASIQAKLNEIDHAEAGERLRNSFAGRLGRAIEPAIAPLGFDWKIGIGIVASFAAREVFVSTMAIVYNVGESDDSDATAVSLSRTMQELKRSDGTPVYSTLVGVTLMIFYVFALQCVSTVAIVRRETNSWRWPVFQWIYMGVLAWVFAFITYHGGRWLGWG